MLLTSLPRLAIEHAVKKIGFTCFGCFTDQITQYLSKPL